MESQIIGKEAGINPQNGDTVLQYFEVQPDNKSQSKYICDVSYLVEQIEKEEYFYVYRGNEKVEVFVNHEPNGEKFIQTKKDKTSKDNLWNLPDFEHSKDDFIRKGTPKPKEIIREVIEYQEKPFSVKNLIPYLLPALILGLLLPILYCWLSGGCFCNKPISPIDSVYVHDTVIKEVVLPCPMYDVLIDSKDVNFLTNKSDTSSFESPKQSLEILEQSTQKLLSDTTNLYVDLRAYADFRGTVAHNKGLSERREKSIREYLLLKGVKLRQIKIQQALGKLFAKEHATPLDLAKDRKVEIRIYGLRKIPVVPPTTKK
jgi:outer membrane protein OmpA-like peptidoglycan-associated protein